MHRITPIRDALTNGMVEVDADGVPVKLMIGEDDTGWRVITSWDDAGKITGDPLPENITPTKGIAGSVQIRRHGRFLSFAVRGATLNGQAQFNLSTPGWALRGAYQRVDVAGSRILFGWSQISIAPLSDSVTLDKDYGATVMAVTDKEPFPTVMIGTPA